VTAIGVIAAIWTLRRNHDWNRRHYAATMVVDWNDKTAAHRKAIESLRPGLIDKDKSSEVVIELTEQDARRIYCSDPVIDHDLWSLRFHFVELLNHLESIAVAYHDGVGDRAMIAQSFRSVLISWRHVLRKFIDVVEEKRGYKPWRPYIELVDGWERPRWVPRPPVDAEW
jgi:hypothetical protein